MELPPGRFARTWIYLQRSDVLARLAVGLVGALMICVLTRSWVPPFSYREGYVPDRSIAAKVAFRQPNERAWEEAKARAFQQRPLVYRQDSKELVLLRAALQNAVTEIVKAPAFKELNPETWKQFEPAQPPGESPDLERQESEYDQFISALGGQPGLPAFEQAVGKAFASFEQHGLLEKLPDAHGEGNQKEIAVYPIGRPKDEYLVQLQDVLISDAESLHKNLKENLPPPVAERVFTWLKPRLHSTLTLDEEATQRARDAAAAAVPAQYTIFEPGQMLAPAGKPLDPSEVKLLKLEHEAYAEQLPWGQMAARSTAVLAMLAAIFALCGHYLFYHERRLLSEMLRLVTLVGAAVATVALVHWASLDPWRAALIPLLLFGMTFAIAYHRDVALVLAVALAIVLGMTGGEGLGNFMIWTGVVASAIVQLGRIRSRSKLIKVGAISAVVALLTTYGVGLLNEQPPAWPLLSEAVRNALWTLAAGFLVTGLLPMIENFFGVLTEISLLEWGDVSHPLLQELVRRAPGTYNHSINVAAIAEAAAESIGACGLLVRVGAYFHDIGKMLKPDYFVENQSTGSNRHDALVPAMSTLIIIAHVKDGADLARQHDLPEPIVDFIEQHHGTTLVEYFYRRANERSETDPNGSDVAEASFRYPGPKPQTIEAAVLMLADSVEGAARALVEPTPSRIESLVEEIALKKLLDGQFDECHLTLEQLRTIEDSLIKSLTGVYHGRIKYPGHQRTA